VRRASKCDGKHSGLCTFELISALPGINLYIRLRPAYIFIPNKAGHYRFLFGHCAQLQFFCNMSASDPEDKNCELICNICHDHVTSPVQSCHGHESICHPQCLLALVHNEMSYLTFRIGADRKHKASINLKYENKLPCTLVGRQCEHRRLLKHLVEVPENPYYNLLSRAGKKRGKFVETCPSCNQEFECGTQYVRHAFTTDCFSFHRACLGCMRKDFKSAEDLCEHVNDHCNQFKCHLCSNSPPMNVDELGKHLDNHTFYAEEAQLLPELKDIEGQLMIPFDIMVKCFEIVKMKHNLREMVQKAFPGLRNRTPSPAGLRNRSPSPEY